MTKVHKVTLLIVDHDDLGDTGVASAIECNRFANDCIFPKVMDIETKEVEWSNDHPMNQRGSRCFTVFKELFPDGQTTS